MADRFIEIEAPGFDADNDELVVTLLTGFEGMSRLFNFQLGMISKNLDIRPEQFIGQQVNLAIQRTNDEKRHINGFISRFSAGGIQPGHGTVSSYRTYHAEVVPWLWFLTQTTDCRVFNKPPEDKLQALGIIEEVLRECSHNNFAVRNMSQAQDFETEYCVQYRESDFNFISRLMEQFGIYYYFVHRQGSHQMVLSDHIGGYGECAESSVSFAASIGAAAVDHLTFWEHDYEFVPGKFTHTDYDFKNPSTNLNSNSGQSGAQLTGHENYELFDYPGNYDKVSDGTALAGAHMGSEEVAHNAVRGGGTCRTFTPGHTFNLENHAAGGENAQYLCVSVQHVARQPGQVAGSGAATHYSNSFHCIPGSVLYRPPRTTPKPVVSGIQTALVVGPQGEEIHCDKYGRVRVRFHWEREGVGSARHEDNQPKTADEKCTCWIRVAHQVAGNRWGFMALPRIGQEVVVDFLEGNPDRPLIVGSVYNQEQMPHYELPDHHAKSYIKTNSTKGGDGFNELMFDDKADEERVYLHAERDMDAVVKNHSREHIWGDRHRIIGGPEQGGDLTELLHGSKQLTIKKHQLEHIHGSYGLTVGNGESEDPGVFDFVIENQERKSIGAGGKHLEVAGDCNNKIDGQLSTAVGGAHQETCGNYALEAGMGDVYIKGGMNVVIEAGMQLTIKVGGSFVSISPAGVNIVGPLVNINSGGAAGSGAAPSPSSPDPAAQAVPAEPDEAWDSQTGHKSARD